MKHTTSLMAAVSLALLAAAGGCRSAGPTADAQGGGGESAGGPVELRTAADPRPAQRVALGDPAGKPFIGRWKVDTEAIRALYPDDKHQASRRVSEALGHTIEIVADGTAMVNGERARWQTDGQMLWGAPRDGWPDGLRLRLASLDGGEPPHPPGAILLQVGERDHGGMFGGGGGGAGAVGGDGGGAEEDAAKKPAHPSDPKPDAGYVFRYDTYALVADAPAPDLSPGDVAGTWRLNFEETERASEAGVENAVAAGVLRSDLPYNDGRSFEAELKGSMAAPPVYIFRVLDASAPPAPFDAKEGRTGTVEWQEDEKTIARYTFDLWRDYVVLYRIDGWHGIKPNRAYVRIVNGKLAPNGPSGAVLTRVP